MNGQVGDGVKEYAPGRQREGDRWTTWESLKKDGGRERKREEGRDGERDRERGWKSLEHFWKLEKTAY